MDGNPKDYSSMYCEDAVPHIIHHNINNNTNHRTNNNSSINHNRPPVAKSRYKLPDGCYNAPRHSEHSIDMRQVVAKLKKPPEENHGAYAIATLDKHFSSVFINRRKSENRIIPSYKVYVHYSGDKETYVVRVNQNTLRAVREKLPKQGNYRYFFKRQEDTCEEIELDDSSVPFLEKDGLKHIYCQVFSY